MDDFKLYIATATREDSAKWKNKFFNWSDFLTRLQNPKVTRETLAEYQSFTKDRKSKIKNVGGYFGGYLRDGSRAKKNVSERQLICLDIDHVPADEAETFENTLDYMIGQYTYVLHSSHSHAPGNPRYRLLIPLAEEVAPVQYGAIAEKLAEQVGFEYFDTTTFQINRFMHWPSVSKDAAYVFQYNEAELCRPDEILALYKDWKDLSERPSFDPEKLTNSDKQKDDPREKPGVIGAFCRVYSMHEAIATYLSDIYEPVDAYPDRYTYIKGSSTKGVIIYDDSFAYSLHETDPAGNGHSHNSFDLVKIHMFGNDKKAFDKMCEFATSLGPVKKEIQAERRQNALNDFNDDFGHGVVKEEETNDEWLEALDVDKNGVNKPTAGNLSLIFNNDPDLKKLFRHNLFNGLTLVTRRAPWDGPLEENPPRLVTDFDLAEIRSHIEIVYGISSKEKVRDAFKIVCNRNAVHPVRDYLKSLEWDGIPRIDTLLLDYFGANDCDYTRMSIRKTLVGAVARVHQPGCKFELMLVLTGDQGARKSTFFKELGKEWFSDSFHTLKGNQALEQVRGSWIIEIAELAGLDGAGMDRIKHFFSIQKDKYRPAYGETIQEFKRQCIFVGSFNNDAFLVDQTGNRRFLPVAVNPSLRLKDPAEDLAAEVDQIWAEAMYLYKNKLETIYLNDEENAIADEVRAEHMIEDIRQGEIEEFLELPLPKKWDTFNIDERIMYYEQYVGGEEDPDDLQPVGGAPREFVCTSEIWHELFKTPRHIKIRASDARNIGHILANLPNWKKGDGMKYFKLYGKQRYYERINAREIIKKRDRNEERFMY